MELLFTVSILAWLGIFFYLLVLHLRQLKIERAMEQLHIASEPEEEMQNH